MSFCLLYDVLIVFWPSFEAEVIVGLHRMVELAEAKVFKADFA
jgi:hypothetical protein